MINDNKRTEYKTCRLTVVVDGMSDRVLDIYPAEHERETVRLNNQNGLTRYKAIQRFLNNYCPRHEAVPEPAPWHAPGDYKTIVLKEKNIPKARLVDGNVFKAPPQIQRAANNAIKMDPSVENAKLRMDLLEKGQEQIMGMMSNLAQQIENLSKAKKPGRPKKDA